MNEINIQGIKNTLNKEELHCINMAVSRCFHTKFAANMDV